MKMFRRIFHDITNINKRNIKLTIHKSSHRRKLVRWLYEVTRDFQYSQATFAMAVYILDSHTQKSGFDISSYQLIGITALFIAAKMEECKLKSVEDYVAVTDNYVQADEILEMEREIMNDIDFDIKIPHSYLKTWYLQRMSSKYTLIERREILFAAFACIMESNSCTKNMYCIYLEGIREAEKVMSGCDISGAMKFYIENNITTQCIKFEKCI